MFRTLNKFVKGTVTAAGEVVRYGTKATSTFLTEVVAFPLELYRGKNDVSDGLRKANRGVKKATDAVVDTATPFVRRIAGAPLNKAEHVKEIIRGVVEASSPENRAQGLERLRKAAPYALLAIGTAGLVDEEDVVVFLDFLSGGADRLADAAADTAAETMTETVADAGVADPFVEAGAPAGSGLAATAIGPDGVAPRLGSATVRFGNEPSVDVAVRLAKEGQADTLRTLVDNIRRHLPSHAREMDFQLDELARGAFSNAEEVLQRATRWVNVETLARTALRFKGSD